MFFPTFEAICLLHADLIDTYGGPHGLRDENLLRSALDRAENRYYCEPDASVARLAAALGWGLIKNHVFVEGNKRIGLATILAFLEENGHRLTSFKDETQAMVLRVAASEMDEQAWTVWLERVVARKP